MMIRCQLENCNTPIFELRRFGDDIVIVHKTKHHGEEHISLIGVQNMVEEFEKEESPDDPTITARPGTG